MTNKLSELFDCSSNWQNGLSIHMTREHSLIEQLDGLSNAENVDKKFDEREGRQNEQSLPGTYNI